ncbi:hypothetical protein AK812_SmicGene2055 [Symbiodinium microadriaticum]|uniref:Uncharacterized protein n=1 Tax=Symbiodinium microadriaticum TaxID=2951 RepID=A0A1Q9F2J2_SYMMI|nr:hypothetical protein AK812_SmicGene2055 [Symbiodinium microadriaticum]
MGARERIRGSAAFSASREVGQAALTGPGMVSSQINHNMKASVTRYHETTEQIKYYDCVLTHQHDPQRQWWCMRLARTRETHFAESDAFDIVCPNLRDLLRHCADEDASVRTYAHYIVSNYGAGGLRFVKQMIADAMLTLMGNLLSESTGISQATLTQVMQCTGHLDNVVRTLAKPQRQKWVSLLVEALESLRGHESETLTLIADLKLLWRADDDPCRTYAEAEQQLKALKKQANNNVWLALCDLLCREGGEEALKGIREFFGSREAELEKALEAQEKRQERMIAEMERQTVEVRKKMEAQIAEEVRVGTELKERIEALQACRVVDYCRYLLSVRGQELEEKKLSKQLEATVSGCGSGREKDIEKLSEDLEVSHKEKKFMQQKSNRI